MGASLGNDCCHTLKLLPAVTKCNAAAAKSYLRDFLYLTVVHDRKQSTDEKGRSQRKYPGCIREEEREPRRYKLKLQEFLQTCISVSVGLGFLPNSLHQSPSERSNDGAHKGKQACVLRDSLSLKIYIPKAGKYTNKRRIVGT